ncbi:hypothetical protein MPTK1_5g13620 [Marchantia polymorpha subsp. ruderalis]|uniref:Uncharacterized protein n=2 Tax=Marchantia polymorpha TaxID=3197 RepID=A0AAF6BI11_MARPO|nr:hypothetical protein MARPO_0032s0055 [Marchantia polymorpha]PTQ41860.1 hypothetical protein MARPO_0032s0055 [Marchantia polymorpha]BBN11644.1 hypothetical protein Mp_5g13620 [Marchantia polymorpha subsp. ruderalis]BBN11645.1 hypothetical protein Mp_5g13620 [Marchantia polymorpha subsp. ruderalis]|eukprot:PTQ41859.1 hypothetical protein MARPO_0032s0055 [Marchantia polymorpha]
MALGGMYHHELVFFGSRRGLLVNQFVKSVNCNLIPLVYGMRLQLRGPNSGQKPLREVPGDVSGGSQWTQFCTFVLITSHQRCHLRPSSRPSSQAPRAPQPPGASRSLTFLDRLFNATSTGTE